MKSKSFFCKYYSFVFIYYSFSLPIQEVGLSETRISRDYAELGMAGAPSLTGFSGLVEWDFTPDNVPIPRRPIASGWVK